MFQMTNIPIETNNPASWPLLSRLSTATRQEWLSHNLKAMVHTLEGIRFDESCLLHDSNHNPWHTVGFLLLNDNLYHEAEFVYDAMVKKARLSHANYGIPAYYLGIARFLQGRHKDAYADFRLAWQHEILHKNVKSAAGAAMAYMDETIFPTKEAIHKNQNQLITDLNTPRVLEKVFGANTLRTIHKWNSSTPLFSHGYSQGGGYFFTLRNPHGQVKGIAIDPGYDFFNIFRDLDLGIADIDAIIITHDHDDHTESVEGILSLLAKYNDHNKEHKSKVLDIFGSAGALLKFHGLLSATDPFGNREINFKLLIPGSTVTEIEGQGLMEKYGMILQVNPAYHKERWTSQESAIGVTIQTCLTDDKGMPLCIGISGDTRWEKGLGRCYQNCQLLLLNVGSIEKEEGQLLHQHLGLNGCVNLIKEARLGKPILVVLTEFGEELSGRRVTISKVIENWSQPMEGMVERKLLRVIPADVNLEVRLTDLNIRESDTNVFFDYPLLDVDESKPELLKYRLKENGHHQA